MKLKGGAKRKIPQKLHKTLSALGQTASWNYSNRGGALTIEKKNKRYSKK